MYFGFQVIFCLLLIACTSTHKVVRQNANPLDTLVDHAINTSLNCLAKSVVEVKDTALYPTYGTKTLQWQLKSSDDWTSGFYPGCLWLAYELSKHPQFRQWAINWTKGIERQKYNTKTHDLGFRFGCSFGNGLRLLPYDTATARYKDILLTAANTMDKLFRLLSAATHPTGTLTPSPTLFRWSLIL